MPVITRRTGDAVSDRAKKRIDALKTYPTLDTFRNPLTRGIARHFANEAWLKALTEIDFDYRISDVEIAEIPCVQYETAASRPDRPLLLYVHGGAFVCGSPHVNAATVLPICHLAGCEGVGVDYTLLPEAFYPTQINQIDQVYRALVERDPSRKIVLVSDSAGSAITLAAIMRWRDEGVKSPAGAIFISPVLDGKGASDTHITLDGHDPLIKSTNGRTIRKLFRFYAPECALDDPKISAIYGDFQWLPPMLVHVGTREVLLGDAARLAEKARRAGVRSAIRVFDGMFHLFHMHWSLDEAKAAHQDIAAFVSSL